MPIIKQAAKKLRHDRKRTKQNSVKRLALKNVIKTARRKPSKKTLTEVFSALDKAAKMHLIHKNKASRLKSNLAKLLSAKKS